MDTFMEPGDTVTGRIRWEQPVLSLYGYIAEEASAGAATFTICCPQGGSSEWTLTSALPGQHGWRLTGTGPDPLRQAAEAWLVEFVSSLGAVFPEPRPADPDCGECGFGLPGHDRRCSHYSTGKDDTDGRA